MKLSPEDRREAESAIAEIRTRPAYHLLSAWIAQHAGHMPKTERPSTSVGWLCNTVELATGARIEEDTAAVALEDLGFRLKIVPASKFIVPRDHDGLDCNLDEHVLLDIAERRLHGALPPQRFQVWGDGERGPQQ